MNFEQIHPVYYEKNKIDARKYQKLIQNCLIALTSKRKCTLPGLIGAMYYIPKKW